MRQNWMWGAFVGAIALWVGMGVSSLEAATVSKGQTFAADEQITNTKLHNLVDNATVTAIVSADITAGPLVAAALAPRAGGVVSMATAGRGG